MKTISMLSVISGIPMSKLRSLEKYGLEFEENDFEIDFRHQKAINDLRSKRLSPYVMAYVVQCKIEKSHESYSRLEDIYDIADCLGFSLADELSDIEWYNVDGEKLLGAKLWIDRAAAREIDKEALTRISSWCKAVLAGADKGANYSFLSVRLLNSVPKDVMADYPRFVQRAINRVKFFGYLDGWWHDLDDEDGKKRTWFCRPDFDL